MSSKTIKQRSECLSLGAVGKGKTWPIFCSTIKFEGEKLKGEIDGGSYGEKGIRQNNVTLTVIPAL